MILSFRRQAVIVLGPARDLRRRASRSLVEQGFPVDGFADVAFGRHQTLGPPPVVVLVTPRPADWEQAEGLGGRIVVLSADAVEPGEFVDLVTMGADAVLDAAASPATLAEAVLAVGRGESFLDPVQVSWIVESSRSCPTAFTGGPLRVA